MIVAATGIIVQVEMNRTSCQSSKPILHTVVGKQAPVTDIETVAKQR